MGFLSRAVRVGAVPDFGTEIALGGLVTDRAIRAGLPHRGGALEVQIAETKTEIRIPAPLPVVRCDPAVSALFRNLITNSLKYNDKSERWVEIGVCTTPAEAADKTDGAPVFYVRDNGIGIRDRDHDKIFEIFRRLHGPDKFGGGTGAGLTIARKIVERHGGRIWIESKVGEGTTFYFTLHAAPSR